MALLLGELDAKRPERLKVCEISVRVPGENKDSDTILGRMYKKGGEDCQTLATVTA